MTTAETPCLLCADSGQITLHGAASGQWAYSRFLAIRYGIRKSLRHTIDMAWYDRDYAQNEYSYGSSRSMSGFGRLPMWSVTTWLIAINVAVFVLDRLALVTIGIMPLFRLGYFSAVTAMWDLELWRFFTFQFLHAGLGHIFFNMLGLYFFGPLVEYYLGSRRFLAFYLLCGMAGSVAYLLLWQIGLLVNVPWVPLVGASAGIFGILIAAARIAPNAQVMLLFPPIPMSLRTLAWVLLGIAAFSILVGGPNAGGQAAHLGGAVLGLVLIQRPRWLNYFTFDRSLQRFRTWRHRSSHREMRW